MHRSIVRLSLWMRCPIHEVIWLWPKSSVAAYLEFLAREPVAEERIELLLARLNTNYLSAHMPENGSPPRLSDFLSHREAWNAESIEQEVMADLEYEQRARERKL